MPTIINGSTGISLVQDSTITSAKIVGGTITPSDLSPDAASIGVGQTWQNVVGGRALATTYYNTTGKPIFVNVQVQATTNGTNTLTINGVIACQTIASGNLGVHVSGVVPSGASYSADSNQGSKSLISWNELR